MNVLALESSINNYLVYNNWLFVTLYQRVRLIKSSDGLTGVGKVVSTVYKPYIN